MKRKLSLRPGPCRSYVFLILSKWIKPQARLPVVTPEQFHERHVAAVKRLLESVGVVPGASLETVYRGFARNGGTLDVSVKYDPPIGPELYDNENLGTWVPSPHGQVTLNSPAFRQIAFGRQLF